MKYLPFKFDLTLVRPVLEQKEERFDSSELAKAVSTAYAPDRYPVGILLGGLAYSSVRCFCREDFNPEPESLDPVLYSLGYRGDFKSILGHLPLWKVSALGSGQVYVEI